MEREPVQVPMAGWGSSVALAHLSGSEDYDMLDIPPGEAGAHLQHKGDQSGSQGGCSRSARVPFCAARPPLQIPICCCLQRNRNSERSQPGRGAQGSLF